MNCLMFHLGRAIDFLLAEPAAEQGQSMPRELRFARTVRDVRYRGGSFLRLRLIDGVAGEWGKACQYRLDSLITATWKM